MATKTKKTTKTPEKKEIIDVSSSHTDEDILALEEKGYKLRFSAEDFRELPEETVRSLSYENARDYHVTKGAVTALKKNGKRKELGFEEIEIVDPLRGKPHNKLQVEGKLKGWHYCWKRPDEVSECKRLGYVIAEEADTPGATKASSSHTIQKKDGQDDLILMRVPERLFRQHLQANAIESRRRSGATMKTVAEMTKKAQNAIGDHSLDDVEIPGLRDFTTEETVPLRQEMARAAR